MKRSPLLLGVALAAIAAPALAADLTITAQSNTPTSTSNASSGPGNITINQGARIIVKNPGAAVTIDSNNTVLDSGIIQNANDGNAVGVHLVGGVSGNLTLDGASAGIICVSVDCKVLSGSAANNVGVLLDGAGAFTGPISLQSGATIVVSGTDAVGVLLKSQVTGNVLATSTMTITGEGATVIRTTAPIVGEFTAGGALSARGTVTYTQTNVDALTGSVIAIGANITGGFVIAGPGSASDSTLSSTLLNSGTAATVLIAPSVAGVSAADIVIDPRTSDAFGAQTFSVINRGSISATENDPGISTTGMLIGETGTAAHTVTLTGGFYNRGKIVATAESDNIFATKAASVPTDAYGLIVGNGATIKNFVVDGVAGSGSTASSITLDAGASTVNDYYKGLVVALGNDGEQRLITAYDGTTKVATIGPLNGSSATWDTTPAASDPFRLARNAAFVNDGQVQATMSGNKTGTVMGMKILEHGNLTSLVNTGTISALATSTDTSISNLSAYAIQDLSGTLVNITNLGRIAAAATTLDDGSQSIVALDLSHATANETIVDSGVILGEVRFGSAQGNATVAGNQLRLEGTGAVVNGSVLKGAGTLDIHVSEGGTGGLLQTTNTRATTLNVGAGGGVAFAINKNTTSVPLISTTGNAAFAASTTMSVTPSTFLPASQVYTLVSSDTANAVHLETPSATTTLSIPYMYKGTVSCDAAACGTDPQNVTALTLTLQRKSANELGLTGNSARIYGALGDAALGDDSFGAALLGLSNASQVQTAIDSAVPDIAGGVRALSVALTDQATGVVAARQRSLMTAPAGTRDDLHFWTQEFYNLVSQDRSSSSPGFGGAGQGIALGAEWGSPASRYGVGYTFFSSEETERHPRDTKTNGDWNMASAYAGWRFGDLFVSPQASVAEGSFSSRRSLLVTSDPANPTSANSLLRSARAQWSSYMGSAGVSTGYIIDFGGFQLIPELALDGLYLRETAYKETGGGGMGLSLKSQDQKSVRGFAGVLGQGSINYEGGNFLPQFVAGYSREFLDSPATIDGTFESAPGSPFHLVGPPVAANKMIGGMSFAYVLRNWSAGVNYDASASSGAVSQSATVNLSSRF